MELPKIERGVLLIGASEIALAKCDLDALIHAFGFPVSYSYLIQDARFLVFEFTHELGSINAYVFFLEEYMPVKLEREEFFVGEDRGVLAELQIELDEAILIRRIGKPQKILRHKKFKFVQFPGHMLGRIFKKKELDAISFMNPNLIQIPQQSFLFQLNFWLDSKLPVAVGLALEREQEDSS